MKSSRTLEYVFFFVLLISVGYLFWKLIAPLSGALIFAAIVATICYPLYERILRKTPRQNATVASIATVVFVVAIVVVPLVFLGSLLFKEAVSIYTMLNNASPTSLMQTITNLEAMTQKFIPEFSLDLVSVLQQVAGSVASEVVSIFASTATTIFLFFIALIALFYFFRDGKVFVDHIVAMSPLQDTRDSLIVKRIAVSVRSVALGTVFVALVQGVLTGFGLWLFGFERAILWGSVAAIAALVPGLGTAVVFAPAVIYLILTDSYIAASGVAFWGIMAVGLIDNILGPYVMSRGNKLHPFLILISVLGGLSYFGPIGFILGPVIMSLFLVLLELYGQQMKRSN